MEIWRPIKGYEGLYEVSNKGRVRSLDRNDGHKGKYRLLNNVRGYLHVDLSKNGSQKYFRVHRLVADAFIPNPENKTEVNHKDGSKGNNSAENLEWTTRLENQHHALNSGLLPDRKGVKNGQAKLTEDQVVAIYKRVHKGEKLKKIAEEFGVAFGTISSIKLGKHWGWLTKNIEI